MWSTTVVLSAVLVYYQVFGGEVQDVTTIYEVGLHKIPVNAEPPELALTPPCLDCVDSDEHERIWKQAPHDTPCIHGVTGRVHARTNALGLGIINEEYHYFGSESPGASNITFDANYYHDKLSTQWQFKRGPQLTWKSMDDLSISISGIPITKGKPNMVGEQIELKIQNVEDDVYLIFTEGPESLIKENIYAVMYLKKTTGRIYFKCDNGTRYSSYPLQIVDRDGYFSANIYCQDYFSNYYIQLEDYLTFSFGYDGDKHFKVYRGKGGSKTTLMGNFESYAGRNNINYFTVTTKKSGMHVDSISVIPTALEVSEGEMISPFFTPQSNVLCLKIVFHSFVSSANPGLEVSIVGLFQNYIHLDSIQDIKEGWNFKLVNVSLENLDPIKVIIRKSGGGNVRIARIAGCSSDGEEVTEHLDPISVCPVDQRIHTWGSGKSSLHLYSTTFDAIDPAERITNLTNYCWHGGELTSAGCACPPGFTGSKCDTGCGRNRYGQDCEGFCSFHSEECRGLLMCTKFTGCRCAPGYRGYYCTEGCAPGWYGNDCSERCGHCAGNSSCDIYTGKCSICENGYLAPQCKLASVYYGSKPELTSPSYGTIIVSFDPNNYVTEDGIPQLYQIQLREKGQQWKVFTSKSLQKSNDESEKNTKISENMEGLKSGILYQVRVLLIDANFQKYDGDLVQIGEVLTKCDIPTTYDYKVKATSNTTAIQFYWSYVTEEINWCPVESFEVTWKEGWKNQNKFTTESNFTLSGLVPGLPINFRVRAKTSGGLAPYSKPMITSARQTELPPVEKLRVVSSQSTSVEVLWEPPKGSGDSQLRYTISYKCVDRPACSPGCQNVSEGQLTQRSTSITLSPLLPFTKYLVTVSAEGGAESSIFVGTTKVVPTEVPVPSAQRLLRTNTSVTVFWDQVPVCTGFLLGYNYQLTKASEELKILASGFTQETNASFHNLTASTEYVVRVFVFTVAGWNPQAYLSININTSATVPEAVRNLTIYKRGRGMLGLRWAEPRAVYGQLKSFTVSYSLGQEVVTHTVQPSHCIVWPDLYCHTIEGLRSNRRYNVSVSARNSEVAEDGALSIVSAVTKESPPSAPVNLKVNDSSSTSVKLEWNYPEMANGIVRSFLISIEETEKFDQESCCQIYPFVEISVKEESPNYNAEVSGLHPASTYFVSVSGKTVGLGPSQSLVVSTRPPHVPFASLPNTLPEVEWILPKVESMPDVNNSDVYTSLIRVHLLLAILEENQSVPIMPESGITDPKLDSLLQQKIGKTFYFIMEYNQDDYVDLTGTLEDNDSPWGRPPALLPPSVSYKLVATQVLEYNGVYNVDLRYSGTFSLTN